MCRCTLWIWCSRDTVSIATKFTVQACRERRWLVIRHAAARWACKACPQSPCEGQSPPGARWATALIYPFHGDVAVGEAALLRRSLGNGPQAIPPLQRLSGPAPILPALGLGGSETA